MTPKRKQDTRSDEVEALREELEHYKSEKENIRDVVGQIGGRSQKTRNMIINIGFLVLVVGLFSFDVARHSLHLTIPYLPPMLLLELAVLLVSLKIIWMIHERSKVDHFEFWVLNSIEFRLNVISRRIASLEEAVSASAKHDTHRS